MSTSEHDDEADPEEADLEKADPEKADLPVGKVWVSSVGNRFMRVVCDEAQHLRNPRTRTSEAVRQIGADHLHFLTATMLLNHTRDGYGYLSLIFKKEWRLDLSGWGDHRIYEADYNPARTTASPDVEGPIISVLPDKSVPGREELFRALDLGVRLYIYDPDNYHLVNTANDWNPAICKLILPPILRSFVLRQTMATQVQNLEGQWIQIGQSVPPYRIVTVELAMTKIQDVRYEETYDKARPRLFKVGTAPSSARNQQAATVKEGRINLDSHRTLMHATLDSNLPRLITRKTITTKEYQRIKSLAENDLDHGASYLLRNFALSR
ncbi:hypothetical protein B7463_g707, partial [Scytalidium lignicola]